MRQTSAAGDVGQSEIHTFWPNYSDLKHDQNLQQGGLVREIPVNSRLVKYYNLARYLEGVVFLVCGSQKALRSGDMLIYIYILYIC